MRFGILSDTHNNQDTTRQALDIFREAGIKQLLHCGDITGGAVVMLFKGWNVRFVYGNIDHNRQDLAAACVMAGCPPPQRQYALTLGGYPVALLHGHNGLNRLIRTQEQRYILHGHTHQRRDEIIGKTRVINPGALGGRRPETRSVAILDVTTDDLQFIELE
ncbi:metallophosphoesterase family protein [Chloroflexota bacterium]